MQPKVASGLIWQLRDFGRDSERLQELGRSIFSLKYKTNLWEVEYRFCIYQWKFDIIFYVFICDALYLILQGVLLIVY